MTVSRPWKVRIVVALWATSFVFVLVLQQLRHAHAIQLSTQQFEIERDDHNDAMARVTLERDTLITENKRLHQELSARLLVRERVPQKTIEGSVEGISENLAQISLARDHGIKIGVKIVAYRLTPAPLYLGELAIHTVEDHRSIAEFTPARRGFVLKKGDGVCFELER